MHRSHLPLKTWLMAVHIVTSHSNGISALQLQAQLGLGSYKSAWLLLHKLRRAMVDPDRSLLEDLVEIDEATLPFRTVKDPTTGGQGRSRQGKMRIAGAVELSPEGEPRRIRLAPRSACSSRQWTACKNVSSTQMYRSTSASNDKLSGAFTQPVSWPAARGSNSTATFSMFRCDVSTLSTKSVPTIRMPNSLEGNRLCQRWSRGILTDIFQIELWKGLIPLNPV